MLAVKLVWSQPVIRPILVVTARLDGLVRLVLIAGKNKIRIMNVTYSETAARNRNVLAKSLSVQLVRVSTRDVYMKLLKLSVENAREWIATRQILSRMRFVLSHVCY